MDRFSSNLTNVANRPKVSFELKALSTVAESDLTSNLGVWQCYAVLEAIGVFKSLNSVLVSYAMIDRQARDVAERYVSIVKWSTELGLEVARGLDDPIASFRRFKKLLTESEDIECSRF